MTIDNFSSIDIEGGNHVGKGETVNCLAKYYCELGIDTSVISFPYYSTPIGYAIRNVITEGINEAIGIEKDREVILRMALFALNRLEILNCILSESRQGIYLFDRGPMSNSLTIAYSAINNEMKFDEECLVDKAINFDRYFINKLNIQNCVIKLEVEEKEWKNNRGEKDDLYEEKDVQAESKIIYNMFQSRIGDGWRNIVTKRFSEWRNRDEIKEDCIEFISERLGIVGVGKRNRDRVEPYYLGLESIEENLYKGCCLSNILKERWRKALKGNDKGEIYQLAGIISKEFVVNSKSIEWYNTDIKSEVINIIRDIPEVFYIFENLYGEEFVIKYLNSLYD